LKKRDLDSRKRRGLGGRRRRFTKRGDERKRKW